MGRASDHDFELFFRNEYPSVVRSAVVLTGDRAAAEDVAQEAFARLYANWRKVSAYERPGAWVRRVAINLAVSSLRRRRRNHADPPPAHAGSSDPDLQRAILGLPRAQRSAVVLHYLEDRPIGEVADILGCSPNTVKVHLHRARAKLAAELAEEVVDA